MTKLWVLLIFGFARATNSFINEKSPHNDEPSIKVTSQDFRNTQTNKVCLIASMNASLVVHVYKGSMSEKHTIRIPNKQAELSTDGSYCDTDYKSLLALAFNFGQLNMTFERDPVKTDWKKVTYCEKCNFGTWKISSFDLKVTNLGSLIELVNNTSDMTVSNTTFAAVATNKNFGSTVGSLKTGIVIRRAYFCLHPFRIPLEVTLVNDTAGSKPLNITAQLDFDFLKVQPFLVGDIEKFLDPQFCDVDWLAHVLVILLPLCYFAIFLIVNKHKEKLPCVARWQSGIEKKPKLVIGGEGETDALPLHGTEDA